MGRPHRQGQRLDLALAAIVDLACRDAHGTQGEQLSGAVIQQAILIQPHIAACFDAPAGILDLAGGELEVGGSRDQSAGIVETGSANSQASARNYQAGFVEDIAAGLQLDASCPAQGGANIVEPARRYRKRLAARDHAAVFITALVAAIGQHARMDRQIAQRLDLAGAIAQRLALGIDVQIAQTADQAAAIVQFQAADVQAGAADDLAAPCAVLDVAGLQRQHGPGADAAGGVVEARVTQAQGGIALGRQLAARIVESRRVDPQIAARADATAQVQASAIEIKMQVAVGSQAGVNVGEVPRFQEELAARMDGAVVEDVAKDVQPHVAAADDGAQFAPVCNKGAAIQIGQAAGGQAHVAAGADLAGVADVAAGGDREVFAGLQIAVAVLHVGHAQIEIGIGADQAAVVVDGAGVDSQTGGGHHAAFLIEQVMAAGPDADDAVGSDFTGAIVQAGLGDKVETIAGQHLAAPIADRACRQTQLLAGAQPAVVIVERLSGGIEMEPGGGVDQAAGIAGHRARADIDLIGLDETGAVVQGAGAVCLAQRQAQMVRGAERAFAIIETCGRKPQIAVAQDCPFLIVQSAAGREHYASRAGDAAFDVDELADADVRFAIGGDAPAGVVELPAAGVEIDRGFAEKRAAPVIELFAAYSDGGSGEDVAAGVDEVANIDLHAAVGLHMAAGIVERAFAGSDLQRADGADMAMAISDALAADGHSRATEDEAIVIVQGAGLQRHDLLGQESAEAIVEHRASGIDVQLCIAGDGAAAIIERCDLERGAPIGRDPAALIAGAAGAQEHGILSADIAAGVIAQGMAPGIDPHCAAALGAIPGRGDFTARIVECMALDADAAVAGEQTFGIVEFSAVDAQRSTCQ